VLRFDADNTQALKRVQDVFREQLLKMDSSLPLPF
jgi:phosphomannomutase/phosphoglucomutase